MKTLIEKSLEVSIKVINIIKYAILLWILFAGITTINYINEFTINGMYDAFITMKMIFIVVVFNIPVIIIGGFITLIHIKDKYMIFGKEYIIRFKYFLRG